MSGFPPPHLAEFIADHMVDGTSVRVRLLYGPYPRVEVFDRAGPGSLYNGELLAGWELADWPVGDDLMDLDTVTLPAALVGEIGKWARKTCRAVNREGN